MSKCDIIIPIYNSPEWVKLCVYSLFKNTPDEYIEKVYLMNDNSDSLTENCIENLRKKYSKIEVYKNENNLGFVKNVNKGLEKSKADYVLLLNTDCLLSKNAIPKLISHIKNNKKIGLICPVSSNAANLSYDLPEHYSYMQINDLFYENFKGKNFDACTVVGNCLMITRECLNKTGFLDEAYGMGYGEETDYQFKAHTHGFEAKVAIDTYVFHKSEVSFGNSPEKQKRLDNNREIFFSRWGNQYYKKLEEYQKNDPIEYIKNNLDLEKITPEPEVLFYLPDIHQNAGGVHIVVDIVNYLNINGFYANIVTERIFDNYKEIMIFSPSYLKNIKKIKPKCIVGTIYPTMFFCDTISNYYNIPCVNFMQGYEMCFDNGEVYRHAELACRYSQNILAISNYLKEKCKKNFNKDAEVITNGINLDLLYNNKPKIIKNEICITMSFRNTFLKGDFILSEILKQLTNIENNIKINIIYSNENMKFPINNNKTVSIQMYKGPLNRKEISNILDNTDIYVDTSLMEGFGLMSLEAMAAGVVPVLSESFGVDEYAIDGENSYIIKEVNNADKYVEKIDELIKNPEKLAVMSENSKKYARKFDIDERIEQYINYFKNVKRQELNITEEEEKAAKEFIIDKIDVFGKKGIENSQEVKLSPKRKMYKKLLKLFPKSVKTKVKNFMLKMMQE
ncbi:MAG: glycosyltransferase [Clostridia bacterium]|nr:glycosyltransferase [Clostridia bacterium]